LRKKSTDIAESLKGIDAPYLNRRLGNVTWKGLLSAIFNVFEEFRSLVKIKK